MNQKPRIIAEFCQNHNGHFDTLRRMIDAAAGAGATHGKIQTIFADDLSYREEFEEGRLDANGQPEVIKRPYQPEYDRLKGLELSFEEHEAFIRACDGAGIEPMTTVFSVGTIARVKDMGWRSVKVASYDCGSMPLVRRLSEVFDELFVSTGSSYDDEIETCATVLRDSGKAFVMLHCVTIYPTPLDQMNLRRMEYLASLAPSVGLSDHSLVARDGVASALMGIYLGASTIERHFTILPADQTKDGPVSIRPEHVAEMVQFAKLPKADQKAYLEEHVGSDTMEAMIGVADRELSNTEILNRGYYRGRFCTKVGGKQVFNWDERALELA